MIRIEQGIFITIMKMKTEMEMADEIKKSYNLFYHLTFKIKIYSGSFWMETILYNEPRFEFIQSLWKPCESCHDCDSIQSLIETGNHPYFTIKTNDNSYIIHKKQNLCEIKLRKKYGWKHIKKCFHPFFKYKNYYIHI